MSKMLRGELEELITSANNSSWSIRLTQHPDNQHRWECHLTRRLTNNHNSQWIAREVAYAQASTALGALCAALDNADSATPIQPAGVCEADQAPRINLLGLLGLTKLSLPVITRRI